LILLQFPELKFSIKSSKRFQFSEATEERAAELLKQENPISLVNRGGKSWKIYGKNVGIFASINNVLNRTYKTGGYEQAKCKF
jgi:hypothetical protein